MSIQLTQSSVMFNEDTHTYTLDGKRLMGITELIHEILGLGIYPQASDYTADYLIPRAGSRGTAVHHAIQTYDELGIKQTTQTVKTRYCKGRDNEYEKEETWDVSRELENYIRQQKGFTPVANEYAVSDNIKWASMIDNVWRRDSTGGIWLFDTKTNNIDLYPTCGYFREKEFRSGRAALMEYLSWQLSIYAELFEAANPGLKVEGLGCNWLHQEQSDRWGIQRKPAELVRELLSATYTITDSGAVYFHPDLKVFGIDGSLPAPEKCEVAVVSQDAVDYMASLMQTVKEAQAKLDEAKAGLRQAMETHGVSKWDSGLFTATIAADCTCETFDTKAFKAAYPDLYKQFTAAKPKKGGFTIKLKDI